MFRMWCKLFTDNHLVKDITIEDSSDANRTSKVFHALERVCHSFDLSVPIWLDKTVEEFKRHDKAKFNQDNFIEHIDFDFMEIQVIEED
jgi:hypothetical protein